MSLLDTIRIALRAIFANRLRSALTSLGLIIGVSSVIVLIAIGQGTQKGVTDRIEGLGTGLIFIESSAAATTSQGGGFAGLASSTLVQGDATAIKSNSIPGVTAVAARMSFDAQTIAGANNVGAEIVMTSTEYAEVRDLGLRYGSFLTASHDQERSLVAVLGARVADTLYPGIDPVGQEVRLSFGGGRITLGFAVIGSAGGTGRRPRVETKRSGRPGIRPDQRHGEPPALPLHPVRGAAGNPGGRADRQRCRRATGQGRHFRAAAFPARRHRTGFRDPEPGRPDQRGH